MIVKVQTGYSFKSTALYHLNDKGTTQTDERVAWTHTENTGFDDPQAALTEMIYTAEQNSHANKTVVTLMLAWSPDEKPDKAHMIEQGRALLEAQGLAEHQAVFVCHQDEPQPHLHIIANRVHPDTHKSHDLPFYKLTAQKWALEYEKIHGIRCQQRVKNAAQREAGVYTHYQDDTIKEAWEQTDSGKAFHAMLDDRGWSMAFDQRQTNGGRKKEHLLAITPSGRAVDILREINKGRAKGDKLTKAQFRKRFADVDLSRLPTSGDADKAAKAKYQKDQQARQVKKIRAAGKASQAARQGFNQPPQKTKKAPAQQQNNRSSETFDRAADVRDPNEKLIDTAIPHGQQQDADRKQRKRVEAWGQRQLAAQQGQHHAATAADNARLYTEHQRKTAAIKQRYDFPIIQLGQQIKQQRQTIKSRRSRFVGIFYSKKQRLADRHTLQKLQTALQAQQQNKARELAAAEQSEQRQRQELEQKQQQEKQTLERRIAIAVTRQEIPTKEPQTQHTQVQKPQQSRGPRLR